jgi:hypothetical protein
MPAKFLLESLTGKYRLEVLGVDGRIILKCWDITLRLGYDGFLPNPFQFIIHSSPFHSTPYNLSYRKSVVK